MATTSGKKDTRDPQRERMWRDHLKRWRADGSTIRAYCIRYGIGESTFHFWRREIERRDCESQTTQPTLPAFVPVVVTGIAKSEESPIEIELSGAVMRIRAGCDRGLLADVFALLRNGEARP